MKRAYGGRVPSKRTLGALGSGEGLAPPMVSPMKNLASSRVFRIAGGDAFEPSGIGHGDIAP